MHTQLILPVAGCALYHVATEDKMGKEQVTEEETGSAVHSPVHAFSERTNGRW